MRIHLPAIDEAYHRGNRQPKALAGAYGFLALVLLLIWVEALPLPKVPMALTIVLFGITGLVTSAVFFGKGFHSNAYRFMNLLESEVFLIGLVVTMANSTESLALLWAFYLLLTVLHAQTIGAATLGLVLVIMPPAGLIAYQAAISGFGWGESVHHLGGLLLAGGLFMFFGRNRQDQLELSMRQMQTQNELVVAQTELQAQRKLRGLEEDWLAILEKMATALVLVDEELETVDVRGATASNLDVQAELNAGFLHGLRPYFTHAEDLHEPVALFGRALVAHKGFVDVRIVALPLGEREERFAVLIQDASERVALEESNRTLMKKMVVADKLNSVGLMAAGIAHEVNNPLGYVLGNVEYLMKIEPLSDSAKASLNDIQQGLQHILSVMGDLRGFSHNAAVTYRETSNLVEIVQRACRMVGAEVRHHARFAIVLPEEPVYVRCQPERIQQIVVNLLVNAWQALPARPVNQNLVQIEVAVERGTVKIRVSDNGVGMPDEVQRKVFDLFFTTKAPGTGTGLGLSIAYNVALDHNGDLTVSSQVGQGTTFTLTLPTVAEPSANIPVLIVDDEDRALQLYSRALEKFRVTTASTVASALELMSQDFAAVLCDVRLPDGSGFDLYEKAPERLQERFVFLTALPPETQQLKDRPPRTPILHKPIALEKLEEALYAVSSGASGKRI